MEETLEKTKKFYLSMKYLNIFILALFLMILISAATTTTFLAARTYRTEEQGLLTTDKVNEAPLQVIGEPISFVSFIFLTVLAVTVGVQNFHTYPEISDRIAAETKKFGWFMKRQFNKRFKICLDPQFQHCFQIKFHPKLGKSQEWCMFTMKTWIKDIELKESQIKKIAQENGLAHKNGTIYTICDMEELPYKLLTIAKAIDSVNYPTLSDVAS